jgi:hypothetical protein
MFESTIPFGEPELMRASAYRLYLDDLQAEAERRGTSPRISSLSPSVRADLYRFEADGHASEALEVMAACVRHAQRLTVHLRLDEKVVPVTVFPEERLVHCPVPMSQLLETRLTELEVMHVEPAVLHPPGSERRELVGDLTQHYPLAPLLWTLALRGARSELLPEIAGPAAYRVTPALDLAGLPVSGALLASITRLRRETSTLRELAEWPGLDRERAARLLNALYLQAGLMVCRSHPEVLGQGWFGVLR